MNVVVRVVQRIEFLPPTEKIWVRFPSRTPFILIDKINYDKIILRRYSLVVKQILGKDQRTVQFCLSAPLGNLFEIFELLI